MTVLRFVNMLILQWFFIRLSRWENLDGAEHGYGILLGVVPLTGWWTNYIGPLKAIKITRST